MNRNSVRKHMAFFRELGNILAKRYCAETDFVDKVSMDFARYLRAARSDAGLSQMELAEKSGLSEARIIALEHGLVASSQLSFKSLHALAEALGEEIEDFALILEREVPPPLLAGRFIGFLRQWRDYVASKVKSLLVVPWIARVATSPLSGALILAIILGLTMGMFSAAPHYIVESQEVAEAKARYISAQAELVQAQVAQTEAQTLRIVEKAELEQQAKEAEMALRRQQTDKLVQLACTLLPWLLGFSGVALCAAVSGVVGRHLVEADHQRQEARAEALSEERRLLQVWMTATRHPVASPGSGGDEREPDAALDTGDVDIIQLLQRLRGEHLV